MTLILWLKTLHLGFAVCWFAGIFYLPRILVNLALETQEPVRERLLLMGQRLYRFMHILMGSTLLLGLWLLLVRLELLQERWMQAKLLLLLLLIAYQLVCGRFLRLFARGDDRRGDRFYRWFNELPVLLLFLILILAILRPTL